MPPLETPKLTREQVAMAEAISSVLLEKFLEALQSKDVADKVIGNWTQSFDTFIGRSMRRLGTFVFFGMLIAAAIKFGVLEKLTTMAGKL